MTDFFKSTKIIFFLLGLAFWAGSSAFAAIDPNSGIAGSPKDDMKEVTISDKLVFPTPQKPSAAKDPFVPLVSNGSLSQDLDSDAQSDSPQEFNIKDLKIQGLMILGTQASILVQEGNDVKKYGKGDTVFGYTIKDITTKGVELEKDGKEVFVANAAR